ncbi:hypothetical protein [Pseudonocardia xishanensis]|uniref:hypothetical protein n=1 Tax=Pseudonocardia xishanensis TaxID=630995 RepID=UPI0031EE253A
MTSSSVTWTWFSCRTPTMQTTNLNVTLTRNASETTASSAISVARGACTSPPTSTATTIHSTTCCAGNSTCRADCALSRAHNPSVACSTTASR